MGEKTTRIDLGFVNAYLVRAGADYILIDTGIGKQWNRLETALLHAGSLPDRLKLVVITHGDYDHTGNCAELKRKYRVPIAMHPGDAGMVRDGVKVKRQAKGLHARLIMWLGPLLGSSFQKFTPDISLQDGDDLSRYGWPARVVHTPGHTKGSIAVLTEEGNLFVGDTLTNGRKPGGAQFIENFQELQRSMAALKGLGATMVYPGHGNPFPSEALALIPE